jgi:hypothetical protein
MQQPPPPQWARVSSFTRFLYHTQRRTTVGRTPLDEWSAPRRDLYLTTHNTHNRETPMPSVGYEPTIPSDERPQTHFLDRAATGTGLTFLLLIHTVTYHVLDTVTSCGGTGCLSTASNEACFRVPMSYARRKKFVCKISNGCGDYYYYYYYLFCMGVTLGRSHWERNVNWIGRWREYFGLRWTR